MFCENCGKKLIRGYSFCMECGTPVPPEVLEEGGLPARNGEQPDETTEKAEKTSFFGENKPEETGDVQETMPGIQPIGGSDEGTLVFCPNCGMRMQHNTEICEKCGMRLGNKPASSVPLINNNPMDLDGGFGGFGGGGISGFSDNDINRINSFMGGGMPSAYGNDNAADNLFGTNSYSASDIETLNRQMSNFSASSSEMPAISKTSGAVRQKEPEQGEARKVEDFSMSDGADDSVPITDTAVPIIEGCSMDEDHSADVSLDPYTFLGNSMDDSTEERVVDNVNIAAEAAEEAAEALNAEPVEAAEETPAEEVPEPVEAAEETFAEEVPEPVEAAEETPVEEVPEEKPTDFFGSAPAEEPIDDFIPEEMGFIAETAPVISEEPAEPAPAPAAPAAVATERKPVDDFDFRRPQKPQNTAPAGNPEDETHKGNLVYCRTCGQDMYDTEKFCKNCGATYKGAYVPPKTAPSKNGNKETPMVFGKIPLPKFAGITAAIVGVAAVALFLIQPWRLSKNTDGIVDDKTQSSSTSSTSAPVESSTSTTSDNEVIVPSTSSSSSDVSSSSVDESTSSSESVSSSTSSSSSSSSKTSSSKTSSSSRPVVTPTTDAKIKSLEQDRKKIMSAVEQIAGEVGKMEALSQNVIYAMNNSTKSNEEAINSFYETKFATSMISVLRVGKVSVDRAVNSASPSNSEFNSLYTSLKTLKTRYDSYYNFIISPKGGYSAFTKNCQTYYSMVTSAMGNLTLNKFTGSYSAADKNSAYKDMVSAAITDIRNSADKFTTLQTQLSGLGTTFERKAFTTLTSNLSTYADAAGYAMKAKAYSIMLKGVSSSYSAAADHIDSAYGYLSKLTETCSKLPKTTAESYISTSGNATSNARSYANRAASAIK